MADKAIIREGYGKPSYEAQIEVLSKQVSPETGKRLFTDFSPTSPDVYVDRKRFKSHREADDKWLKTALRQAHKGIRWWVAHPSVLSGGENSVRECLLILRSKGGTSVIRCDTGKEIQLTPETAAFAEFIGDAARAPLEAKLAAMRRRRLETGNLGGSTGRKPKYTDAQIRAVKALWISHQGTIAEFEIKAGKLVGQERLPYRTAFRWARAGKVPWPPMGSRPAIMPRTKRKRR